MHCDNSSDQLIGFAGFDGRAMDRHDPKKPLRTGFTTGACAAAAAAAACEALLTGRWPDPVTIALPRGHDVSFPLSGRRSGDGWAEATICKDAGDDPDVTHGAMITAAVALSDEPDEVEFRAGPGVGTVTKPGLPLAVGEPAINPVPRLMMAQSVRRLADLHGVRAGFRITISVAGGAELAEQTWNPRLGIVGGLSILGTTGIVRPYSCSAWIASIHRGIDVARSTDTDHVLASTGSVSESAAAALYALPTHALLDMGDFVGGMLKYLRRHPVRLLTVAGGFGKLTKLAQGHTDLHSRRSRIDFGCLARTAKDIAPHLTNEESAAIRSANTSLEALAIVGQDLGDAIARGARKTVMDTLGPTKIDVEILVFDRAGVMVGATSSDHFLQRRCPG